MIVSNHKALQDVRMGLGGMLLDKNRGGGQSEQLTNTETNLKIF